MPRLLLIDDDPEVRDMLVAYLGEDGFDVSCESSAGQGLAAMREAPPDLLLLDVLLPDVSGFDVLRAIRAESDLPVIVLTGRDQEVDRVLGLELGADDYVVKPIMLRELAARIRAVLRRRSSGIEGRMDEHLRFGQLDIWPQARSARVQGRDVHLTAAEFEVLQQLAMEPGRLVERTTLLERALGSPAVVDDCVLNVHICNLRRKLGDGVSIKTIRGRGYLLAHDGATA